MDLETAPLAALERLDSFPYRHRVRELMSTPPVVADAGETVAAAARIMSAGGISSVLIVDADGRPDGIVTERDVLRAVGDGRGLDRPLGQVMSCPVVTVDENAFIYVALGRLTRKGLRHLVAVDAAGRATGVVTSRALLRLRVGHTLQLGDRLAQAATAAEMDAVRRELPALAGALLGEDVGAVGAAAVISAVYCDISARAAELVEAEMAQEPRWGRAPAPWCFMVLGSGGRGESLLAPDQDNAIVHAGTDADDAWFAEAGRRIADCLDASGIPYCKGGVMARNEAWRKTLDGWSAQVAGWTRATDPQALLMVDIFYDFMPVHGDARLAEQLRGKATNAARTAPEFLRRMSAALESSKPPLGLFGSFQKREGRVDLKLGGLLPLVAGTRVLALRYGIAATSTRDRLARLVEDGAIPDDARLDLEAAQETVMRAVLEQQIADLAAGGQPSVRVDPGRWSRNRAALVRDALRRIESLRLLVVDALSAARSVPH